MKIVIVNFNTQILTTATIHSINRVHPDCDITIFDNSDKTAFVNTFSNVKVIDNTKGQIINFQQIICSYRGSRSSRASYNNFASVKHCMTIQKCIDIIGENFILMDSDILLKKDFADIIDESCVYSGAHIKQWNGLYRVAPYMCFLNVKMMKEKHLTYFNPQWMHGLNGLTKRDDYDTGGWLYIECKKMKVKTFNLNDYLLHYKGGSWPTKVGFTEGRDIQLTPEQWLEKNKELWKEDPK